MSNVPAFPRETSDFAPAQDGMDLRDYFAAKAMQALIPETMRRSLTLEGWSAEVSRRAYLMAEAMISERLTRE